MGSPILRVVDVPFDDGAVDKRDKTVADLCLSSAPSLAPLSSSLLKHPYLNHVDLSLTCLIALGHIGKQQVQHS